MLLPKRFHRHAVRVPLSRKVYPMRRLPTAVTDALPGLESAATRALQFVRSTSGMTAALVGMSRRDHVEQNLAVACVEPAPAGVDSLFARR